LSRLIRDDVDRFFEWDVHVPTRTVYMGAEVDETMAERFMKAMCMLEPGGDPIMVVMNNVGGDEYHGMGIYDAIQCSKCHITLAVYGHAMSMGSWILQAADERIMAPNATLMMHYGTWGAEDHVKYVRVNNKEMERVNALMEGAYLERMKAADPKFSLRKLKKMLEDEVYMPAREAVELGLADKVIISP